MIDADFPRQLPKLTRVNWPRAIKDTIKEFLADDAMGMGAEMAYHFLFALFPTLLVLLSFLALLDQRIGDANFSGELLTLLQNSLPRTAYEALKPVIETTVEKANVAGQIFGIGFALAIWSASAGVEALMKGFNIAYDAVETRNFIKKKAFALALTVGTALFVVLAMVLLVFGGRIGEVIANAVGLGDTFSLLWNVGRIVLVLLFLMLGLAALYYVAPNVKQEFVWVSPGAVLAAVLWLVVTAGFSFYMNNFGAAGAPGVVGGVIVLITWMYYSSLVLLLGAEMNGLLGQRHDPTTIADPRQVATGPNAQTRVSGGRLIGAAAPQAKHGDPRPAAPDPSAGRSGRHRRPRSGDPEPVADRRNATGRQDPGRVGIENGARAGRANATPPGAIAVDEPPRSRLDPAERQAALDRGRQKAPAKHFIWNLLSHGSTAIAIQGTRQLLTQGWRTVFRTRPPANH